jgi:hypothetical protein
VSAPRRRDGRTWGCLSPAGCCSRLRWVGGRAGRRQVNRALTIRTAPCCLRSAFGPVPVAVALTPSTPTPPRSGRRLAGPRPSRLTGSGTSTAPRAQWPPCCDSPWTPTASSTPPKPRHTPPRWPSCGRSPTTAGSAYRSPKRSPSTRKPPRPASTASTWPGSANNRSSNGSLGPAGAATPGGTAPTCAPTPRRPRPTPPCPRSSCPARPLWRAAGRSPTSSTSPPTTWPAMTPSLPATKAACCKRMVVQEQTGIVVVDPTEAVAMARGQGR